MCTKCAHDEVLMKNGKCGSCPDGTGFDGSTLKCNKCRFNTYSRGKGIEQHCAECPKFYYANKGATACFQCPEGQGLIAKNKNKGKCDSCKTGYYYDDYFAQCIECLSGVGPGGNSSECFFCDNDTQPNADNSACV